MNYSRADAKLYARTHMKGIWAAALTPFKPDRSIDEAGFRANLRHWVDDLGIDGVFVCGKQGEFFAMSVAERKRTFEHRGRRAQAAAPGPSCPARTRTSTS